MPATAEEWADWMLFQSVLKVVEATYLATWLCAPYLRAWAWI